MTVRLQGLAPLLSPQTRVLVLGSFPGAASLAAQQYYAHPQNQFWKILQAIWPSSPYGAGAGSYENRSKWLLAHGLVRAVEDAEQLGVGGEHRRVEDLGDLFRVRGDDSRGGSDDGFGLR